MLIAHGFKWKIQYCVMYFIELQSQVSTIFGTKFITQPIPRLILARWRLCRFMSTSMHWCCVSGYSGQRFTGTNDCQWLSIIKTTWVTVQQLYIIVTECHHVNITNAQWGNHTMNNNFDISLSNVTSGSELGGGSARVGLPAVERRARGPPVGKGLINDHYKVTKTGNPK